MTKARECGEKQRHATKRDAEDHARALRRGGALRVRVYACRYCGAWHVGRWRAPGRRRTR